MPVWKLNIFVRAIRTRVANECRTGEDILTDYPKLTETEKQEILAAI